MALSHTGTYWQSHLQNLCATKKLPNPAYEVFEHSGGCMPLAPSPTSAGAPSQLVNQSWYSCVVTIDGRDYETAYVYRAEENAKEKAAKKAYEALNR